MQNREVLETLIMWHDVGGCREGGAELQIKSESKFLMVQVKYSQYRECLGSCLEHGVHILDALPLETKQWTVVWVHQD